MSGIVSAESGETVNKTTPERVAQCTAPAKVNLTLAVLGRRPDGYHELESWVVLVQWHDELEFAAQAGFSLDVTASSAAVPVDESNLVWRAAVALARAAGKRLDAAITLRKRIPVGAGLGGGSSDAAATLLGLNALWELGWTTQRLLPVAAELGSDVPLFLERREAIIRGRGDRVEQVVDAWKGWLAMVVPPYPVLTPEVYRRWSAGSARPSAARQPWLDQPGSSMELASKLFNDLERAAFAVEPRLKQLHGRLDGLDGRPVRMTGSGSCLFAIFDGEAEALAWGRQASERLEEGEELRVVETL
jgi:4-diphosphocytidyl-2-C-methyl-D-erythritol kinase